MPPPGPDAPEQRARQKIDAALAASGWVVQDRDDMNVSAGRGVAVREFKLTSGHGFADYLLFVDGKAAGVLEAKQEGFTLLGVEPQAKKYAAGLPANLDAPVRPLPFLYIANGGATTFTNLLDPKPKSRRVFQVHRPETLADWLAADTLDAWVKALHVEGSGLYTAADDTRPSSLRARIATMPPLERRLVDERFLFPNQLEAVTNLERSLKQDKPRALIQMATGSGKTFFAVTALYRLIKFAGARRVLFLVDRANLGEQAEKEFQNYRTPDDQRKFTELYKVQRLTSNTIGASTQGGHHDHPAALLDAQGRARARPERGGGARSSPRAPRRRSRCPSSTTPRTRPSARARGPRGPTMGKISTTSACAPTRCLARPRGSRWASGSMRRRRPAGAGLFNASAGHCRRGPLRVARDEQAPSGRQGEDDAAFGCDPAPP